MPGSPNTRLDLQATQRALSLAAEKLNGLSLKQKVQWLRQHRSADPIVQMQTETIAELYDAVRQVQEAIWPMLSTLPDVSGVREAAAGGGGSGTTGTMPALGRSATTKFRHGG